MSRTYWVYILTSRSRNLYVGVTNDLQRRMIEHRHGLVLGFTARYNIDRLVHCEQFADIRDAIPREKEIKAWRREKKIWLIERDNPTWQDLAVGFAPMPRAGEQTPKTEERKTKSDKRAAKTESRTADPSPPFAKIGRPGSG